MTFSDASSVANATAPGVAGILTGVYPSRSGVMLNTHMLSPGVPSLATLLAANGFSTAGFVANPVVGPGFGFEQGFERFELIPRKPGYRFAKADAVNRAAIDWLNSVDPSDRVFLWLHYLEPHGPYQPLEECSEPFKIEGFGEPTEVALLPPGDQSGLGGVPFYQHAVFDPAPTDGRDYLLRYAAQVRCVDDGIGRMLDHLERTGLLADSVVVITSDHGEALLDDHGRYFSHRNGLTQDQVAVPLILRIPRRDSAANVDRPVSTADIVPTVLALFGIEIPEHIDGADLLAPNDHAVFSFRPNETSIRAGQWKLIESQGRGSTSLFDLEHDPAESVDLAASRPEISDSMRTQLDALNRRPILAKPADRNDLDDDTREALRSLGYLSD